MSLVPGSAVVRNGMLYELSEDGELYFYTPHTEFFVDDIRYEFHEGDVHVRPIVSVIDDHLDGCRCLYGALMRFSCPPTDVEVDRWVDTGDPL